MSGATLAVPLVSLMEVILKGQVSSLRGFPWQHMAASWQAATKITW
jgi:hypothetical protein